MSDAIVTDELRELYPPDDLTITRDLRACLDEIDRLRVAVRWYADPAIDHRRDGPALGWTTCPHGPDQSSTGGRCDTCGMPHGPTALDDALARAVPDRDTLAAYIVTALLADQGEKRLDEHIADSILARIPDAT